MLEVGLELGVIVELEVPLRLGVGLVLSVPGAEAVPEELTL